MNLLFKILITLIVVKIQANDIYFNAPNVNLAYLVMLISLIIIIPKHKRMLNISKPIAILVTFSLLSIETIN